MSDQPFKRPRPSLRALFRGEAAVDVLQRSTGAANESLPPSALLRDLQLALAVRAWTDPTRLLGQRGTAEDRNFVLESVGPSCDLGSGDEAGKWFMRTSGRRHLTTRADVSQAKQALADAPPEDSVARALRYLLAVEATTLDDFSSRELTMLGEVQSWAKAWVCRPVDDDELRRRIARRLLRDDFQRQLPAGFVGHEAELMRVSAALLAPPRRVEATSGQQMFYLHGPGGVGKSSFVAELGLKAFLADPAVLIAVLDFDRPDLDPLRDVTLDFDFLNQLATADHLAAAALSPLIGDIRKQRLPDSSLAFDDDKSAASSLSSGVAQESADVDTKSITLASTGFQNLARTVIVILDTFERVEEAGAEAVQSTVRWLSTLKTIHNIGDLRLLVCGRNDPSESPDQWQSLQVEPILIAPLLPDESRKLMHLLALTPKARDRVGDQRLVDALVEVSQGIPLIIRLIAGLLDRLGDDDIAEIVKPGGSVPAEVVQGILYDRTLAHIPDRRARLYAHPGLVLPQLDVDLIRKVLAPMVEPGVKIAVKDAEAIFRGLQEPRWLTRISADGRSLRQRPDLRALLLRLMTSNPKRAEEVADVRRKARNYHAGARGTRHRAYQLYYDLLAVKAREDLAVFEGIALKPYLPTLRDHIADLPPIAQGFIRNEQGRHLALAEAARNLPDGAWGRYLNGAGGVRGEGERIVERADPMLVLPVWRERPTGERGRPPTFVIQALTETGEWRSDEIDIQAVVGELRDTLAERPTVWRHLLKRLYWLTRFALLAHPGPLSDDHAALLRDVLNQSSPASSISALPGLAAVADAFAGGRKPILTDTERWLASPKIAAIPRIRLVLGALGHADAVRDFRMPSSRDVHVYQSDWPDHFSTLAPSLKAALEPIAGSLRELGARPSIASLESWSKAKGRIPLEIPFVDPKSRDAILLLLGPWTEFYRPVRQALREAFPSSDDIRGLVAAIRNDFTIWPQDFEGDRFVELLERDPVSWFLSLTRFADQARVLDRLLTDAARLAPHAKLQMVSQHYREWDAALTSSLGSYWWSSRAVTPPSPSVVTLPAREPARLKSTREDSGMDRTRMAKQFLASITGPSGRPEALGGLEAMADTDVQALSEVALRTARPEQVDAAVRAVQKISIGAELTPAEQFGLEAIIIPDKRPAIDILDGDYLITHPLWTTFNNDPIKGRLKKAIPSVGRVELPGHPTLPYAGTGFVVGDGLLMTNRHVAEIFTLGLGTRTIAFRAGITAGIDFKREHDRTDSLFLKVVEVVMIHPWWDMALLRVEGLGEAQQPLTLSLLDPDSLVEKDIAVIGYPAFDPRNPADVQNQVFGGVYYVKRLQPGKMQRRQTVNSFGNMVSAITHDASTLGGNSGSAVVDVASGHVVALHFGGSYLQANFSVPTRELSRDDRVIRAKVNFDNGAKAEPVEWSVAWQMVDGMESTGSPVSSPSHSYRSALTAAYSTPTVADPGGAVAQLTIPLTITVSLGTPASAAEPQRRSLPQALGRDTGYVPGEEAVAESYVDRDGYQPNFLGKKKELAVDLPRVRRRADDVLSFEFNGKAETELRYQHYSVVMSRERRMCFFSAVNIDGNQSKKSARVGWKWDPRIPKAQQIMNECYGSPPKFSRGHMTRREDPGWGTNAAIAKRGNEDSMHVTNATPQMQAFNAPIWLALEDYALQHAREDDMKISVFTGPYFADDDPEMYGVRIPVAFWKIIAFVHDKTHKLCATGYQMTQENSLPSGQEYVFGAFTSPQLKVATQVPIRTIAARSGIDLGALVDVDPLAGQEEALGGSGARPLGSLDEIVFVR